MSDGKQRIAFFIVGFACGVGWGFFLFQMAFHFRLVFPAVWLGSPTQAC